MSPEREARMNTDEAKEWYRRHHKSIDGFREGRLPYEANILGVEQLFTRSKTEKRCYMCGHKTTFSQPKIGFPASAQGAYLCEVCAAE